MFVILTFIYTVSYGTAPIVEVLGPEITVKDGEEFHSIDESSFQRTVPDGQRKKHW